MADSTSDISDGCEEFKDWLSSRLKTLGLDEDVFGNYVTGVLDSEDTDEERKDALIGILDGMTEYPLEDLCSEVLNRWKSSRAEIIKKRVLLKEQKEAEKQNKLAEIMEKQASVVCTIKPAQEKSDDNIKKMLVAQYGMFKNMNAQLVADQEKEKRERMKQENDQRKQQIREAQEKQKQKAEERKEKEKKRTQKGERRTR
ncbi:Coiled-coil domain-containing protein 43 [Acropora cervicornis]|uniref:Coiled-coil domain-containing protein 43 n=1 Tax=Acropora cervicornis TaxID=6130 RepID=A0AAD9V3T1_ACRCE|nr:Coiled-coil domain-containing protein 43 [Acropora cervicornis]